MSDAVSLPNSRRSRPCAPARALCGLAAALLLAIAGLLATPDQALAQAVWSTKLTIGVNFANRGYSNRFGSLDNRSFDYPAGESRNVARVLARSSGVLFRMPATHSIEHAAATGEDHLDFHVWSLSFFLGMRLSTTDAGFLDAASVKPGKLVDFVLLGPSLERAVALTEQFWTTNLGEPGNAKRFAAAIHALFLGQYRQALQFEEFIYLYTALDACYALTKAVKGLPGAPTHAERIEWTCDRLNVRTPRWATITRGRSTVVSSLRNNTLHEALFVDEPLGFAVHGGGSGENLPLEMTALVCRFLVALIGGKDVRYLQSPVNTRQRQGLRLT